MEIGYCRKFAGEANLPGDKSISHRVLLLGSLAEGQCRGLGLQNGSDCQATIFALKKLGVDIVFQSENDVLIKGPGGIAMLREPDDVINCLNSGTTARLLTGLLAGSTFFSVLSGDASLRNRPMKRVVEPLRMMGASLFGKKAGELLPLAVAGKRPLTAINYDLPISSAQVKSAILLAGLSAEGVTVVGEGLPSRDHTERLLKKMGARITREQGKINLIGGSPLEPDSFMVPADPSAAAFFIVGAAIHPGSRLILKRVGLNPGRIEFLNILKKMGADWEIIDRNDENWEPFGDILIKGGKLSGIVIAPEEIPSVIDEIPILAVAMAAAQGKSAIRGAGELRRKESDRIKSLVLELGKFGLAIQELSDGFEIEGSESLTAPAFSTSHADHRIAMALAILATASLGTANIVDTGCIEVSFPGFEATLRSLTR